MFDFRYHALSLVAVFLALLIGLLLGVAIGDRGLVSSAENNIRNSLRSDVRSARAQSADLRTQLSKRDQLDQRIYPLLVDGRLTGRRVGIIGLGGVPDSLIRQVRDALRQTGGRLTNVEVIREPIPGQALGPLAPPSGQPLDPSAARRFGQQVGVAMVRGGKAAAKQVRSSLLSSSSGSLDGLQAVVLVRSDRDSAAPDAAATDAFEQGLVKGLGSTRVDTVGAEQSTTDPSQINWFKDRALSSVDDVDDLSGRAALVFALAGASGAFGVKDTADGLLPNTAGG